MNRKHYDHAKLAEIRKSVGTQEDVSKMVNVSVQQLSRAENGKSASFELLSAITSLANRDVKEILVSN